MEFLRDTLLVLHFVGLAALFGGWFVQMSSREKVINNAMFHGALTQLVTGFLLVGINESLDLPVDHAKVGVKFVIAAVILALILINRKKNPISVALWSSIGGLTLLNIIIAVFWR
jgi:hypothetical protein